MSLEDFTKYAQDELNNHPTGLDAEMLWNKVEDELHPEKTKYAFWPWMGLGSFCLLVAFLGYSTINSSLIPTHTKQKESKINSVKTNQESTHSKIIAEAQHRSLTQDNHNVQLSNTKNITTSIAKTNTVKAKNKKIVKPNHEKAKLIANKPIHISIGNTKYSTKEMKLSNSKALFESGKPYPKNSLAIISKLPILPLPVLKSESSETVALKEKTNSEDGSSIKLNPKNKIQFGLVIKGSLAKPITTLSARSNEMLGLLNSRRQSELDLETINLELGLIMRHRSGVYLNLGANYMRTAKSIAYKTREKQFEPILNVFRTEVDPITLDTTLVEALLGKETLKTKSNTSFNNLHTFNVPINIGFMIKRNKWSYGLELGTLLNISTQHRGIIIDEGENLYTLENDTFNWFKDKLNMRLQGSVLLGYRVARNFEILAGAKFIGPTIINEDTNPIRQSQIDHGIQISARYWLE